MASGSAIARPLPPTSPEVARMTHLWFHIANGPYADCGVDHCECPECSADIARWGDVEWGHHPFCPTITGEEL